MSAMNGALGKLTQSRVFFPQLTYRMATFTRFLPATPNSAVVGGSAYCALGPKGGCGVGRWALAHHAGCRTARCVCASMRLCVYVYITLSFAARGRLAEIDPIPQL